MEEPISGEAGAGTDVEALRRRLLEVEHLPHWWSPGEEVALTSAVWASVCNDMREAARLLTPDERKELGRALFDLMGQRRARLTIDGEGGAFNAVLETQEGGIWRTEQQATGRWTPEELIELLANSAEAARSRLPAPPSPDQPPLSS